MTDTKERILTAALNLFAKDGYEAVSVSNIADRLGITKGALYRHYKNKRDIFDSIVERMYEIDAKRSVQYNVPKDTYETDALSYKNVSWDSIKQFTVAQFVFWTEDSFASDFRKMLMLEQYRNKEIAELYANCITVGPLSYMEDIFREMIANGVIKNGNSKLLALEFYSPLYFLINASDGSADKKALNLLNRHIEEFKNKNTAKE